MTQKIDIDTPEVVAYEFDGGLTKEQVQEIHDAIRAAISNSDTVRFFGDMRNLDSVEPSAFIEDMKLTPEYITEFDRFAIVGDQGWHRWLSKTADTFTKADARFFSPQEYEKAKAWIRS